MWALGAKSLVFQNVSLQMADATGRGVAWTNVDCKMDVHGLYSRPRGLGTTFWSHD